ncbi:MAG: fructose-1 6-bisphosphatase [Desulfobulbaceae bacterium]|nr:MAG: fructose-1 6-bisphosphatase [Desulfobulbaceae bacterium]
MKRPVGITVHRQITDSQQMHKEATGDLSGLLTELIVAGKIISAEVNMAGLADVIGDSGKTNIQGEEVQKLDEFANNTIKRRMARSGFVCVMASEEDDEIIPAREGYEGKYTLAFDPMDGSSNIDVNVSIGTIFSIHHRKSQEGQGTLQDILQPGNTLVAAGYIIYGSSTMMVYSTGHGVHGFTLDPSVGEFFLSHENIRVPERSKYFSVNEGNYHYWSPVMRDYIQYFKEIDESSGRPYSSRYIGTLVADFHRNLITGGVFLYPSDCRNPDKPQGKLRLLYEASPLAFLIEQAGGRAVNDAGQRILDIQPESLHERTSLILGSKQDIDVLESFLGKK